jgi:hypothetical protein
LPASYVASQFALLGVKPGAQRTGAKFAEFNYQVVRALADAEERPRWYAKDYFGGLFAPKAVKAQN